MLFLQSGKVQTPRTVENAFRISHYIQMSSANVKQNKKLEALKSKYTSSENV